MKSAARTETIFFHEIPAQMAFISPLVRFSPYRSDEDAERQPDHDNPNPEKHEPASRVVQGPKVQVITAIANPDTHRRPKERADDVSAPHLDL